MELVINKYHLFTESSPINLNLASDTMTYWISGTKTLAGDFTISVTGTPVDGMTLTLYYDGTDVTASGNSVTVLGIKLTTSTPGGKLSTPPSPQTYPYLEKKLMFVSKYKGGTATWETRMYFDATMVNWVGPGDFGANVVDDSTLQINTGGGLQVKALGIANAHISASAAIAYSKLALTGSVVNADISAGAAIAYSKLALTNSILNADIGAAAAIAYSKLALTNSILNADIGTAAAIAYSKLALTGLVVNADIAAAAAIAYSKLNLTGLVVNADIAAAAAIAFSKMAALTASKVPQISAAGVIEASTVTSTELGYLSGATSSLQDQITAIGGGGGSYTKSSAAVIGLDVTATYFYVLDCTSNAISITMPDASLFDSGRPITILRKFTGGAFNITVAAFAGQTVEGVSAGPAGSITMSGTTGETKTFLSNGTDSWVVGKA
jgi:hypothetical protein